MASIYDIAVKNIDGNETSLSAYKGKVLVIVNVASKCGFTPQYEGLQALYEKYRDRGLEILGFPCNQFGNQEPGSESDIKSFCSLTYSVNFPLFAKVEVNGDNTHPLYQLLKHEAPGLLGSEAIKWNFTKFLVEKNGRIAARFAPTTSPASLESEIEKLLAA